MVWQDHLPSTNSFKQVWAPLRPFEINNFLKKASVGEIQEVLTVNINN